jgi:phosphoglycolate phosphatase
VKPRLHVAFDLDGTLIDSVGDLAAAANALVTSYGAGPLPEQAITAMIGDGAGILVRRVLGTAGLDPDTPGALERFLAFYDERLLDTTVAYNGVPQMLLQASRRARLFVLTNKPAAPTQRILSALALAHHFEDVIAGDSPYGRKPAPDGLRALAAGGEQLAMVGDSPVDAAVAAAAGCPFVWAAYGFGAARFERAPDTPYVIDSPADLPAVLDRLLAIRF